METNRKRRGFMKGKLLPFYKSASKPSSNVVQYNSSINTTATATTNTVFNSTYVRQHDHNYVAATAHQPPQTHRQKVSFLPESNDTVMSHEKKVNLLAEKLFGAAMNADESVDVRAATYISSVQERFKLERVNSERVEVHQDRLGGLETRS